MWTSVVDSVGYHRIDPKNDNRVQTIVGFACPIDRVGCETGRRRRIREVRPEGRYPEGAL